MNQDIRCEGREVVAGEMLEKVVPCLGEWEAASRTE